MLAAFPLSVTGDTELYAKLTKLALTLSPKGGHIYTGGCVIITPSVANGEWSFDEEYLSRDGNAFTGLKVGTTRVTYTVGQVSAFADIVISQSEIPQTGQDFTLVWVLGGIGLMAALSAMMLLTVKNPRSHDS